VINIIGSASKLIQAIWKRVREELDFLKTPGKASVRAQKEIIPRKALQWKD
jgi:hypothetical protein